MDQRKKYSGSAVRSVLAAVAIAVLMAAPMTANATIHEIVAAFCSGGGKGVISAEGFLEAPGVSTMGTPGFAKPVGKKVNFVSGGPLLILIGSSPAFKFTEGTTAIDVATPKFLAASDSNHPSALHCPKAVDLP